MRTVKTWRMEAAGWVLDCFETGKTARTSRPEGKHRLTVDFASDTPEVWSRYVKLRGRLAFDIGANAGHLANILAKGFAQVIAVEPCAESFQRLVEEAGENVSAVFAAVSDHEGTVTLDERRITEQLGELTTGDSLPEPWGERLASRTVPCRTLDGLAEEYGQPDFVKIDTEGHETQIVSAGLETLLAADVIAIEIHSAADGDTIRQMISAREFEIIRHSAPLLDQYHLLNNYWLWSQR